MGTVATRAPEPRTDAENDHANTPLKPVINRVPLQGRLAYIVDHVYSPHECETLIAAAEAKGFEPALVNIGGGRQMLMPDVRNNDRCIIDDVEFAQDLARRLGEILPPEYKHCKLVGVNERMRYLRYDPGQKFEPHCDGMFTRSRYDTTDESKIGEWSAFTLQIYLNEGCEGGSTTFLSHIPKPADGTDPKPIECVPKIGRVLMFEQNAVYHEGSAVTGGRKYTIRTEAMYTPQLY